jgi:hypothetical protein
MAAIDDALSAARGAHYGVIAGCAAALLFATTPDRSAPYRAAREDLQHLAAIRWDTVTLRAENRAYGMIRDSSKKVWREFLVSAGGGDTANLDAAFRPLDSAWRGEFRRLPVVSGESTIAALISFNDAVATVRRPLQLDDSALSHVAASCYQNKNPCTITVNNAKGSDTTYLVSITGRKKTEGRKTISLADTAMRMKAVNIRLFPVSEVIKKSYPASFVPITDADGQTIIDPKGDTIKRFVPRLASIDLDLKNYTPAQAAAVLEEKIAGSEQQLSGGAIGVPIRGNLITLAGPILLILAIIYLFFQIDHLTDLAPGNEKAICDFAWPLTFYGYKGITTGIMSLLILPATAVWLLRIHGGTANAFSRNTRYGVWTWCLLIFTVAAGGVCLRARNRLVRTTLAKSG